MSDFSCILRSGCLIKETALPCTSPTAKADLNVKERRSNTLYAGVLSYSIKLFSRTPTIRHSCL